MNSNQTALCRQALRLLGLASAWFVSALAAVALAQPQQQYLPWKQLGGTARDIGIGPQPRGDIWIIGTGSTVGGDHFIYRWNRKTSSWDQMPGGAVRIDVGPSGPMVVNSAGSLYAWNGRGWDDRGNNRLRDVGVGGDGSVWYLGGDEEPGGFGVFKYGGSKVAGAGVRIDVDDKGNPWIVTKGGAVFRYNGSAFEPVPGPGVPAIDIGISAENGAVYVVGGDGWPYKWTGSSWQLSASGISHALNHISVDPAGMPWGVAGNGIIYSSRDQPPYQSICEQPRCDVPDAGGVKGDFDYDCGPITNPSIRQKCDAYNAAIPAAKHACGEPKGKGWLSCVRNKLPKIPNPLPWTGATVEACFKQNLVAANCKNSFPWWLLVASGGKGQLQSCQNAYLESGASACLEGARLIELCGDWSTDVTGSSGNLYHSPWSREACLIEARKK